MNGYAIILSYKIIALVRIEIIESTSLILSTKMRTRYKDLVMVYMSQIQIHWSIGSSIWLLCLQSISNISYKKIYIKEIVMMKHPWVGTTIATSYWKASGRSNIWAKKIDWNSSQEWGTIMNSLIISSPPGHTTSASLTNRLTSRLSTISSSPKKLLSLRVSYSLARFVNRSTRRNLKKYTWS